ncbi:MAG: hypothetical protein INR71_00295 [Terriglobus roseus]|nr:hypothetical protein [Terriglobus roseus]
MLEAIASPQNRDALATNLVSPAITFIEIENFVETPSTTIEKVEATGCTSFAASRLHLGGCSYTTMNTGSLPRMQVVVHPWQADKTAVRFRVLMRCSSRIASSTAAPVCGQRCSGAP